MVKRYILVFLIVAISGCINDNVNSSANSTKTIIQTPTVIPTREFSVRENLTVYVEIRGSNFIPRELNIVNGTTVKWTNGDSASYIVNVDHEQSPTLNKRDSWKHKFNNIGTFEYICPDHPAMPHGKITVE